MAIFKQNEVVLFQGDSITDAGRVREDAVDMGTGYAMMASAWFNASYPELNVRFLNRGVSGDRVGNLQRRWQEDCLSLQPDWVSILVGINDCWRRFKNDDPTTVEDFEAGYRDLLKRIRNVLGAGIIMMEPFVLPYPEDRKKWRDDLDPKIHAVRALAREFDARFVPLDGLFAQASARHEPEYWAQDGVHPTKAGHALIAQHWLDVVAERR